MRINKFEQERKEAKSRNRKYLIRTLQTLFVVVVALALSLHYQRIKSCEDDIKNIQKLQYLLEKQRNAIDRIRGEVAYKPILPEWEIKTYEDLKSEPPPPLQDKVL